MGEKRLDKLTPRPVSDDPADGTWVDIDCETETGSFAIITDVLPLEGAPKSNAGESAKASEAPKSSTSGETHRRRTLDDMRRLSEEIKRKRESGG
jgi:hypothetical protein